MDNKLAIYIPNYNGEDYLNRISIPSDVACIVMDNCSTDNSKLVAQKKGFEFIENDENIGRIGNWCRCVEHFRRSSYEWMKWLFVGDELSDNFIQIVEYAIKNYPEASMVLFDYRIVYEKRTIIKKIKSLEAGYIDYEHAIRCIIETGNIFGAPLGILVSKKANLDSVSPRCIEAYPWAGDAYLAYILMKGKTIAYSPDIIGNFQTNLRKNYSANRNNVISTVEEMEVIRQIFMDNIKLFDTKVISDSMRRFVAGKMQLCVENNARTWNDIVKMQASVFRGMAKMVIRRIK